MSAKHAGQHSTSHGEVRCAEKYPSDANCAVSCKPGENANWQRSCPRLLFEKDAQYALDHQIGAVQQTPDNKCPGRAVPETTEKHDDDQVERRAKWADLISAQRNVKVVAQES